MKEPVRLPAIEYEDFSLRLQEDRRGGPMAYVQHATGGGGTVALGLDPAFIEGWMQDLDGRAPPTEERLRELGQHLYEALFRDRILQSFRRSRAHRERDAHQGLRLRLVFDVEHADTARLAGLPWELLFDPETEKFLARDRYLPLVRFLDVPHSILPLAAEPPLRLLIAGASPDDQAPCDIRRECARISEALAGFESLVEVEMVPDGRFSSLVEALAAHDPHVVHFSGHGLFDSFPHEAGEGYLYFAHEDGSSHPVAASLLAEHLRSFRSVRLAVLTACQSATFSRHRGVDPYSNAAAALVRRGIPAAVAMQFPVADRAACELSRALYVALARGHGLDTAVTEGRLAIHARWPDTPQWAVPALYMRSSKGRILKSLVDAAPPSQSIRQEVLAYEESERLHELTDGFVGREFVFDRVDDFLRAAPRGYLTIVGEPGIGKSALVAELVRRHRLVYHLNNRTANICRHEAFLAHVCAQLIIRHRLPYDTLPDRATQDAGFLRRLLVEARDRLPAGQPLVLLVDALDEVDRSGSAPGVNPLFLPPELPSGVHMVLTSRPLEESERPGFTCEADHLFLCSSSPENRGDIRRYLESRLGRPGLQLFREGRGLSETELVTTLETRSEGNFMYLHHVLPELEKGRYDDLSLQDLPSGLRGYYNLHWGRMRGGDPQDVWLERKVKILAGLTQVPGPANMTTLAHISGRQPLHYVRSVLDEWRPFLDVGEAHDEHGRRHTVYSIYHQSFHDFLTEKKQVSEAFREEERKVIKGAEQRFIEGADLPPANPL